jgi:hypothetical protein
VSRIPNAWKFPGEAARLYHLIDRENAVKTPRGIGTLKKAHDYPGGCQVVLMREKTRINKSRKNPEGVQIMRGFNAQEVEEA